MGTFRDNPVFHKEMRAHLMSRRQSRGVRIATIALSTAMVLLLYWACMRAVFRSFMEGRDLLQMSAFGQLTLLAFLSPSLTANAITQEREQQTWNALLLTRLHADEIVVGKLLARLAPAALLVLAFLPLSVFAVVMGDLPFRSLLRAYAVLIATGLFYGTLGLACSWAFRRTSVATSAAFGSVAFLIVGTVLFSQLWITATGGRWIRPEEFPSMVLNPYLAMTCALNDVTRGPADLSPVPLRANLLFCVLGTLALVAGMIRRLARGPKEMEQ